MVLFLNHVIFYLSIRGINPRRINAFLCTFYIIILYKNNGIKTGKTTLSNGTIIKHLYPSVPKEFTLNNWHFDVEGWTPGATPTEMNKTNISKELNSLKPWSQINGLENLSGIGPIQLTLL